MAEEPLQKDVLITINKWPAPSDDETENPSDAEVELRKKPVKKKKGLLKSLSFKKKKKQQEQEQIELNIGGGSGCARSAAVIPNDECGANKSLLSPDTSDCESSSERTSKRLSNNYFSLIEKHRTRTVSGGRESQPPTPAAPELPDEVTKAMLIDVIRKMDEANTFAEYLPIYYQKSGSEYLCELLHKVVKRNMISCVRELLKYRFDLFDINHELRTPFAVACIMGLPEILELLLDQVNKLNSEKLREPLLLFVVQEMPVLGDQEDIDGDKHYKCFDILLRNRFINVNEQDVKTGNTALHLAILNGNDDVVLKLLEKSARVGVRNADNKIAMYRINSDVFEEFLNTRITTNGYRVCHADYQIEFDFAFLLPVEEGDGEMAPLHYMAQTKEMNHLLRHPVISSFLLIKWYQIRLLFYMNFFIFAIYSSSLITYFLLYYGDSNLTVMHKALKGLSIIGWLCVTVREILQLLINRWRYFRSWTNWFEMLILFLTFVILVSNEIKEKGRRNVSAIIILFSGAELTMLLGALPISSINTHMAMLKRVSINFLKSFFFYSLHILLFAMCFYAIFREDDEDRQRSRSNSMPSNERYLQFSTFSLAVMRTMSMFVGELEASEYNFNVGPVAYVVFFLFVIFISIILMNLLNGLAVNDTQAIRAESENTNLIQRAKLLMKYEKIFMGRVSRNFPIVERFSPLFSNKIFSIKANDKRRSVTLSPTIFDRASDSTQTKLINLNFRPFSMKKKILIRAKEILEEERLKKNFRKNMCSKKCIKEFLEYFNKTQHRDRD